MANTTENRLDKGQRHLPLDGAYNVRDVGDYPTANGGVTKWRKFLRADSLYALTPESQQMLVDYGVRTIIDLRHAEEVNREPNVFADSYPQVKYFNLSLFSGASPLEQHVSGKEAPNLERMYKTILNKQQVQLKGVFDLMLQDDAFPVLVHCTAGKDRTGVVSALILGLAGVDDDTIVKDYALSGTYGAALFDKLRAKASKYGLEPATIEPLLEAKPETMRNTLAYLNENYDNAAAYLKQIGLGDDEIEALKNQLVDS